MSAEIPKVREVIAQFLADYTGWWEKKSPSDTPTDHFGEDADQLIVALQAFGLSVTPEDS